jgi:hypothetical protein
MKYETKKVKPFYHSRMRVDPNNPWKTYPGYYYQLLVQFQEGGKIAFLNESCEENVKAMSQFIHPELVRSPAQLRKIAAGELPPATIAPAKEVKKAAPKTPKKAK